MKRFLVVLIGVLFVAGCAVPPKFRDAMDQDEANITFIEDHSKKKDEAFIAANAWIAKNYKSGKDVIQMTDKETGTLIVKGAYKWAVPVDPPLNTTFWDGWVEYNLTVKVKDNKAKIDFETGRVAAPGAWWNGKYWPKDKMPELIKYYTEIKDGIMKAISKPADEF